MAGGRGVVAAPARGGMVAGRGFAAGTVRPVGRSQVGVFVGVRPPFGVGGNRYYGRGFYRNRLCRFGYCGYGWPYYGYGWGGDWPLWSDYSDDYGNNDAGMQTALAQQQQIDELQDELQQQRYQAQAEAPPPPRRAPASARPAAAEREESGPATVLVFRDQHREEAGNYAIAGDKLYILDPHGRQTVALSELDIPATVKANEDRGVEFRLPGRS